MVLTKALRPRLHRRCFVLPGRLLLFTACFAASRVRPSGPDRGLVRPAAYIPPKEVGGRPSKGECKKKGGGMMGIKMGEGYYSPTPILLQVFCEIVLFVTII